MAKRFLGKALNGLKHWKTGGHQHGEGPGLWYPISELKAERKCPQSTVHRQVKY